MGKEAAYYKGKIDGEKPRKDALSEVFSGTHHNPPSDKTERELYNKGWNEGKKNRK
jgi:hypothetical protein